MTTFVNVMFCPTTATSSATTAESSECAGTTALMRAAARGTTRILSRLIDAGARVDETDATGQTALHYALGTGSIRCVRELVKAGADVNHADERGSTPLAKACSLGRADVAAALLRSGAHVRLAGRTRANAMSSAIAHGQDECVVLLLEHADRARNAPDDECLDPLRLACSIGRTSTFELLMDAGAAEDGFDVCCGSACDGKCDARHPYADGVFAALHARGVCAWTAGL